MFARFRQSRRRLHVSIVEARRVNGSVKQDHIASLGSVETPPSVRARIWFWQALNERLSQLSNRVGADNAAKIRHAIHERIPQPTDDEVAADNPQAMNEESAAWESMRECWKDAGDMLAEKVAHLERRIAKDKPMIALSRDAADNVSDIQANIAKGKISAAQSAALRQQTRGILLRTFAGIGEIKLKPMKEGWTEDWAQQWAQASKK
jgi:hypothetical protein